MAQQVVWLYPESHPAFGRPVHLTVAKDTGEDQGINPQAHAFREFLVEVPRVEPVFDEAGNVVFEDVPDPKPGERKTRIKFQPSTTHPDGVGTTTEMEALCGVRRFSWVHPLPSPDGHPRCPQCEAKAGA